MRRIKPTLLALATVASISSLTLAETQHNPYVGIADRNPFVLKPIPVVEPVVQLAPAVPLAKVVLTGITDRKSVV